MLQAPSTCRSSLEAMSTTPPLPLVTQVSRQLAAGSCKGMSSRGLRQLQACGMPCARRATHQFLLPGACRCAAAEPIVAASINGAGLEFSPSMRCADPFCSPQPPRCLVLSPASPLGSCCAPTNQCCAVLWCAVLWCVLCCAVLCLQVGVLSGWPPHPLGWKVRGGPHRRLW